MERMRVFRWSVRVALALMLAVAVVATVAGVAVVEGVRAVASVPAAYTVQGRVARARGQRLRTGRWGCRRGYRLPRMLSPPPKPSASPTPRHTLTHTTAAAAAATTVRGVPHSECVVLRERLAVSQPTASAGRL